jgi:hypothetical protein
MKLLSAAVLALSISGPAFAAGPTFVVDFEHTWDYANGAVDGYYAGGSAADGSSGANLGVSFVGVSGLSNDADFTYYANAPTPIGVAYAYDTAFMNVAGGVDGQLLLSYSSANAITGAVKAYSGLDGTGTLLGTFDFAATGGSTDGEGFYKYDAWTAGAFNFAGTAHSFDFSATSMAALDNIAAVPEAGSGLMMALGLAGILTAARRRA